MNKFLLLYFIILFALFFCILSCSNENASVTQPIDTAKKNIALVLCEGLWGFNNTTVSRINLNNFSVVNDFVGKANPNFKIGDIGNDLVVRGDTFFVVVTTTKSLEFFQLSTGKLLGYITFPENSAPRKLAFLNDSISIITDLYQDCVYLVNIKTNKIEDKIPVGPAPEFVAVEANIGYVINSGYGDYRSSEPKSGTISVIDLDEKMEIANIWVGPNPVEVVISKELGLLFAAYYNLPSAISKDSLGGIVAFQLSTMSKVWEIRTNPRSIYFDKQSQRLFYLNDGKVCSINFDGTNQRVHLQNPKKNEIWYSLSIDTKKNLIYIGNAMNYSVEGFLLVYDMRDFSSPFKKIGVGVNPGKIVLIE